MIKKRYKLIKTGFALLVVLLLAGCGAAGGQNGGNETSATAKPEPTQQASPEAANSAEDVTINISELSATPKFFAAEANGTKMEIVAVVASDGTVRTAFNTCQVCYSSGRGYYEAEGDELVCQNCGNRFTGDAVGLQSGGCNPVPISAEQRTEKDGVITIPGSLLSEASIIFENWK